MQLAAQPARGRLGFGSLGGLHRRLAIEADEGIELRIERGDAIEQGLHELDRRELLFGDRLGGLGDAEPVQFGHGAVSHRPTPARIGGQGSAAGSVGFLIFSTTLAACVAAAVTSSGNSASALARPARRASSSIIALSIDFSSAGTRSARLVPSVHPLHAAHPNLYMRKQLPQAETGVAVDHTTA